MQVPVNDEAALMAYSEEVIYEVQSILKSKPELMHHRVLKKAMEIEEFLYCDALVKTRLDRNDGHIWQSRDSIREYQLSADKLIRRLRERNGDWAKLFNIQDIRLFIFQVYQDYVPTKRSERRPAAPKTVKSGKKSVGKKTKIGVQSKKTAGSVDKPLRSLEVPRVSLADLPPKSSVVEEVKEVQVMTRKDLDGSSFHFSQGSQDDQSSVVGPISEDATDLLNSMFDGEDLPADIAGLYDGGIRDAVYRSICSGESEHVEDAGGSGDDLFTDIPKVDMRSSLSTALLSGMVENADGDEEEESALPTGSDARVSDSPMQSPPQFSNEDERIRRLNAQRELERKQRQELKPVSNIDKDRKYLLFGDDDDDDDL